MFPSVFTQNEKLHIYTQDLKGILRSVNQSAINSIGLKSALDCIGRHLMDIPGQERYAPTWIENDCRIVATAMPEVLLEVGECAGKLQWFRSYKTPLMGKGGKVIGITGFSLKINDNSLIPLTKQQTACLKELALGNTHKQIAQTLGLAQKTVEHYLDAVKLKLNCKSRAELIMQAIERGLIGLF